MAEDEESELVQTDMLVEALVLNSSLLEMDYQYAEALKGYNRVKKLIITHFGEDHP